AISAARTWPSMRYQSVAATSRCRVCDAAYFQANGLSAKVARGPPPLYDALSIRWRPFAEFDPNFIGRDPSPPAKQVGPMLRGMRKASSNWLGKTIMAVVMGVLIISFGVWG